MVVLLASVLTVSTARSDQADRSSLARPLGRRPIGRFRRRTLHAHGLSSHPITESRLSFLLVLPCCVLHALHGEALSSSPPGPGSGFLVGLGRAPAQGPRRQGWTRLPGAPPHLHQGRQQSAVTKLAADCRALGRSRSGQGPSRTIDGVRGDSDASGTTSRIVSLRGSSHGIPERSLACFSQPCHQGLPAH